MKTSNVEKSLKSLDLGAKKCTRFEIKLKIPHNPELLKKCFTSFKGEKEKERGIIPPFYAEIPISNKERLYILILIGVKSRKEENYIGADLNISTYPPLTLAPEDIRKEMGDALVFIDTLQCIDTIVDFYSSVNFHFDLKKYTPSFKDLPMKVSIPRQHYKMAVSGMHLDVHNRKDEHLFSCILDMERKNFVSIIFLQGKEKFDISFLKRLFENSYNFAKILIKGKRKNG